MHLTSLVFWYFTQMLFIFRIHIRVGRRISTPVEQMLFFPLNLILSNWHFLGDIIYYTHF